MTIIKKLYKSKKLSNHRMVMLKNPLQVTCDLQRGFQHDHSVILWDFWELKERKSGHAEKLFVDHMWPAKGFSAWPLCNLTIFSTFHFKCILKKDNHVIFKTYGFSGCGQFFQSFCISTRAYVISLVASSLVIWLIFFLLFNKRRGCLASSLLNCNFKWHVAKKIWFLTWKK